MPITLAIYQQLYLSHNERLEFKAASLNLLLVFGITVHTFSHLCKAKSIMTRDHVKKYN